ncbi:MAG: Gmad2 immunoglobulin-like domain-containing protein [Ornithinimicrobium sp.]
MTINVQQPQPFDLVSNLIQISGTAGAAFEANFNYEITDGHDVVTGFFLAGDGVGGHGQFHHAVDISAAAFTLSRVFVHVYHVPPTDDPSREDEVIVPVLLGGKIVPGYTVYNEYVVKAGDTLSSIAADWLGSASDYPLLVAANAHTIADPDLISVGQVIRIPRAF